MDLTSWILVLRRNAMLREIEVLRLDKLQLVMVDFGYQHYINAITASHTTLAVLLLSYH